MRLASLKALAVAMVFSTTAFAQNLPLSEEKNFPAERMRPAMDREGIIDVEWGRAPTPGSYDVGMWLWYAHNPLSIYRGNERVQSLVGSRVGASLMGQYTFVDWLELGLELPVVLFQTRAAPNLSDPTGALLKGELQPLGVGDVRVSPKFVLLKSEDFFVDFAVIPSLTLPTAAWVNGALGTDPEYMGENGFLTFAPELVVSRQLGDLRLAFNGGARFRPQAGFLNLDVSHEFFYRGGVAYRLHRVVDVPVELGLSIGGQNQLSTETFSNVNRNPLEVMGEVQYDVNESIQVFMGGGVGIIAGYATPDFRVTAGALWAPRAADDKDGDGVAGDACPDVAEDKDGFEDSDGCPDEDNDKDGILDADDRCPLEAEDLDGDADDDGCPEEGAAVEPAAVAEPVSLDKDGDGINDDKDACPDEAEDKDGFEDSDGCLDADNDKDGVLDVNDKAPLKPEDQDGFEDDDGVPDPDNDKDGLLDANDKCPNEPETMNGNADDDGCPDKGKSLVEFKGDRIEILEKVNFETGKAVVRLSSYALLKQVASIMRNRPGITMLQIEGHTDSRGSDKVNKWLSQKRAKAVMRFLSDVGIEKSRMRAVGYGEEKPIVENDSRANMAKNRRTEFRIVEFNGVKLDNDKGVVEIPAE